MYKWIHFQSNLILVALQFRELLNGAEEFGHEIKSSPKNLNSYHHLLAVILFLNLHNIISFMEHKRNLRNVLVVFSVHLQWGLELSSFKKDHMEKKRLESITEAFHVSLCA